MGENRWDAMAPVEGYWKVQLACFIVLLASIAVVVAGHGGRGSNHEAAGTISTTAACATTIFLNDASPAF